MNVQPTNIPAEVQSHLIQAMKPFVFANDNTTGDYAFIVQTTVDETGNFPFEWKRYKS